MDMTVEQKSYDSVPYSDARHPQTYPSHLYCIAKLFGLNPPDFRKAKVLEIGCAQGGNIIPLAAEYPKAQFLGIDISGKQIETARKASRGLKNVDFLEQSVTDFNQTGFDYIICHGVLSWVPEIARKAIFRICRDSLNDHGIAVVSYNALPGWNFARGVRDMMLFNAAGITNPAEVVTRSRGLIQFLISSAPDNCPEYRQSLEIEQRLMAQRDDTHIYHDYLEAVNQPFYFHEFAATALHHGLHYVGDTNLSTMYIGSFKENARNQLAAVTDIIRQEQYMDFVNNRRFRSSILCKQPSAINRNLKKEQILDYALTFHESIKAAPRNSKGVIEFRSDLGFSFSSPDADGEALFLEILSTGAVPINALDLINKVQKKAPGAHQALVTYGLEMALLGYINLHPQK